MKFKLFIDRERCKGCGLCVVSCVKKILRMSRTLNSRGSHFPELTDHDKCIGCKGCAQICPDAAIEIERESSGSRERTKEQYSRSAGNNKS